MFHYFHCCILFLLFLKKPQYGTQCPNNFFMNLLGNFFFKYICTFYYIEGSHTAVIWKVWLVLRRKLLYYFHCCRFYLLLVEMIYLWYSMSRRLLYESVGEFDLLIDMYYLLHRRVTYCCKLKWYDWWWGESCYILSLCCQLFLFFLKIICL